MLPDFPLLKDYLDKKLMELVRLLSEEHEPILGEMKKRIIFEGTKNSIIRREKDSEGNAKEVNPMVRIEEIAGISKGISDATIDDVFAELDKLAQRMASKQAAHIFSIISEGCEKVGNVVSTGGKALGPEDIFKMLETIMVVFDMNGKPELPTFAGSNVERYVAVMREIESTPSLRQRFEEILQQKKREWDARETARKLVG